MSCFILKLELLTLAAVSSAILFAQTTVQPAPGSAPDDGVYTVSFPTGAKITAAYVDRDGNAYLGGATSVALAATAGAAFQEFKPCPPAPSTPQVFGHPGCSWAFVAKLSPAGALLFLTYLPEPNGNSTIMQIAADSGGNVYVSGSASPVDSATPKFPVTPGAYLTLPGNPSFAPFLAKLNASGSALVYATYFDKVNYIGSLAPDAQGNLYAAMRTEALADLPLVHPLDGMEPSIESGYLAKLDAKGSSLLFATWINGPGARSGIWAMSLDGAGDLYLTGGCFYEPARAEPCVPITAGALQSTMKGTLASYVMKLRADGNLAFSTLLPFSGPGRSVGIALDPERNIVLAGGIIAAGQNQPLDLTVTPGAFQTTSVSKYRGQGSAGFVAKLDPSGSKLIFSTYFGGSSYDSVTGYAVAANGDVVFAGYSNSPDLPMSSGAWSPCHPAPDFRWANGADANYVARISSDGSRLVSSSFVGPGSLAPSGEGWDLRMEGADASGDLYFVGLQALRPVVMRYHPSARPTGSAACLASATHGYQTGLAPGAWTRIRGNAIAGTRSMRTALTQDGTLPAAFEGLEVMVANRPAPLLEILPDQITVVVPFDLPGGEAIPVRIVQNGQTTAELEYVAQTTAPALISADRSGFGLAAAVNEDGSVNSASTPAATGSVLSLYMTGLGEVIPPVTEGSVATETGSVRTELDVSVFGASSDILYAGPAPGLLAGVYQVNIRVPVTNIEGWVPIGLRAIDQFGQSTPGNPRVGIYVKCSTDASCAAW